LKSTNPSSIIRIAGSGTSSDFQNRNGVPNNKRFTKPDKKRGDSNNQDGPNNRRPSLRVGTGKKRGVDASQRRGSLRKRDRSAEKTARADAALERKTVYLPEYVMF
jgi:hypothetical protein